MFKNKISAAVMLLLAGFSAYALVTSTKGEQNAGVEGKNSAATSMSAEMRDAIAKELGRRLPELGQVDEISTTPIPGIFEIRVGNDILYSNASAEYFINGHIFMTEGRRNLTQERIERLNAIDFSKLPVQDAIKTVHGKGTRKMAVFSDPNCGYCKRLEIDLQKMDDVTIYTFLYPILGDDSIRKSQNIWCAADQTKTWEDWMVRGRIPAGAVEGGCNVDAVARSIELGAGFKISGTPGILFEDGSRASGAWPVQQIEAKFAEISKKAK